MENQQAYEKASKRVAAKLSFYIHLTVYVVVNLLLVAVNLVTSPGHLWFYWPLFGWGIGLFFHGLLRFLLREARQHQREDDRKGDGPQMKDNFEFLILNF